MSSTPFKLQLKPPLTIPDPYYLFLSPSENFQLHEILPEVLLEVPPLVLLDVHLEVHFEVLTSSDYIESYQTTLSLSDLSRPLKSQEKSLWWVGGGWVQTKNRVWLRSKSDSPDPPDPHLTLTQPGPGPELDN